MIEIWKDIPNYEGKYQVSNHGNVRSLKFQKIRNLHPGKTKIGYLSVGLCKDGVKQALYVHRLVWEAFNGPIPENMQVNHINEDKTDNRLENLNLLSPMENLNWGTAQERRLQTLLTSDHHLTDEHKQKISKANKGRNLGNQFAKGKNLKNQYWRLWSGSTSQEKPVLQYTLDGIFLKEYRSCSAAAKETGCDYSNIVKCCKGKLKTCGYRDKISKKVHSYYWKYK